MGGWEFYFSPHLTAGFGPWVGGNFILARIRRLDLGHGWGGNFILARIQRLIHGPGFGDGNGESHICEGVGGERQP